ncbi:MAG TPA: multifunctional CCA tRNA nucleotidyl transferase/2'3'-cyclic phosphodiesterase/2'nucleotidase/phosphatase [Gammaproteobacteria bacterium]|nr:multifunctional CCA tRNA nucleotidyl transferase/2'3'-cyclic phosphodiesterase/2'nucleotidase/phosphatase [Gammaproteobacteria bacterium]
MKVYLVGGAVRDKLLGLPIQEKDWVVVGSTPEEMMKLKYRPVGKDFPVFLHPETHEEYALARTERKTGKGYTQFVFHASPDVTLEEDLKRRDLTINAIAEENGKYIDPYHGQEDIKHKLLKHVSEAFIEDPVRILRVGRFLARFYYLGFSVAPETLKLMQEMVKLGEVDALVADRVWQEMDRALGEKNPEKFFEVLEQCGAVNILFPYIKSPPNFKNGKSSIRFAYLFLNNNQENIEFFCKQYPVPVYYRELAILANQYHSTSAKTPEDIIALLEKLDAYRRPERFDDVLTFLADAKRLKSSYENTKAIDIRPLQEKGLEGKNLGDAIHQERIRKLKD